MREDRNISRLLLGTFALLTAVFVLVARAELDPAAMQRQFVERFETGRLSVLARWLELTVSLQQAGDKVKLERINRFVNERIVFDSDTNAWQASDYWTTPLETLAQGRGDCEDFAILKYVSLRLAGVPHSRLRLIYAKARLQTPHGEQQQAHMVLAYYALPNSEPLILDNIDPVIRPSSQRKDLTPVFSFNSEGIFGDLSGNNKAAARIGRLSRWEDAWRRIVAEGFN